MKTKIITTEVDEPMSSTKPNTPMHDDLPQTTIIRIPNYQKERLSSIHLTVIPGGLAVLHASVFSSHEKRDGLLRSPNK